MGQRGGTGPAACGSGIVGSVHICGGQDGEPATCSDAHLQECLGVGMLLYHLYERIELLRHPLCECLTFLLFFFFFTRRIQNKVTNVKHLVSSAILSDCPRGICNQVRCFDSTAHAGSNSYLIHLWYNPIQNG